MYTFLLFTSCVRVCRNAAAGTEFYSDAKVIHDDGNGMLWIESVLATEGGGAIDVGGGNEFGGADEDEGCDDKAETKLDHFWQFGDIEVRVCACLRLASGKVARFTTPGFVASGCAATEM